MKKNISINLFGTLYNIDEDAYNLLENYLQSMQRYFGRQEGGVEIADDIEHRVAELLWKKHEAGMTAIDISVVKEIIDKIGNAEDIAGDGGNKSENAFGNYNRRESEGRHESGIKEDFKHFSDPTIRSWAASAQVSPLISSREARSSGALEPSYSPCWAWVCLYLSYI